MARFISSTRLARALPVLLAAGTSVPALPAVSDPPGSAEDWARRPADAQPVRVVRIIDGDTLQARTEAGTVRIRLLEIDAPEDGACFGDEATEALAAALPVGSTAWVLADRDPVDRYGRELRYLWNADGAFVNLDMVRQGNATAVLFEPNDRFIEDMREAEREARAEGAGLWGACTTVPQALREPVYDNCDAARDAGAAPMNQGEPGYRDKLDRDHDGVACEPWGDNQ